MESRKYQSNQLRNKITMDIVVFGSLRPGWHTVPSLRLYPFVIGFFWHHLKRSTSGDTTQGANPSLRRRGGGGILVKYVGEELLKNHMHLLVFTPEWVFMCLLRSFIVMHEYLHWLH